MSDFPRVTRVGTITIQGGQVCVHDDWEFENCSCRDAARLAALYALERISTGLSDDFWRDAPSIGMGSPDGGDVCDCGRKYDRRCRVCDNDD